MKYLITGGNGFVGKRLIAALSMTANDVAVTVRTLSNTSSFTNLNNVKVYSGIDLSYYVEWSNILNGIDCVVHCAALNNSGKDLTLEDFFRVNVDAVEQLVKMCDLMGVKRFVFLSSAKVVESNCNASSVYYCESKNIAEKSLHQLSKIIKTEIVILRIPPIYGPGVQGNISKLVRLVKMGIPLPFKNLKSKNSLIALDNLVDALILCSFHPAASGKTYYLSDDNDISVPDFILLVAKSLKLRCRLFPFPLIILRYFSYLIGARELIERLSKDSRINIAKIKNDLGWTPPLTIEEGISCMVNCDDSFF